jgi:hypothetical protein
MGALQVRPPSVDRIASCCVGFPFMVARSVETRANTTSSDPSRFTRSLLMPGQLFDVCGLNSTRAGDQVRPPLFVVEITL